MGSVQNQEMRRRVNNRVEDSQLPFRRRERALLRFPQIRAMQKFGSVHAKIYNRFGHERHLIEKEILKTRRSAALAEWPSLTA